jgi:hypothetical protein
MVERVLWEHEAAGSIPVTPTVGVWFRKERCWKTGSRQPLLVRGVSTYSWVFSSTGRALALQAGGSGFESRKIH